jgi:hypothetical protein
MTPANTLDELRRRIGHGTTPVAFAALAEEHRRAGRLDEAVAVCREGLARYPTYASARVTLGRALLDLGDTSGALEELQEAVAQAPANHPAARAREVVRMRMADEPPPATPPVATTSTPDAPAASMLWMTNDPPEPQAQDALPADDSGPDDPAEVATLALAPPSDALAWLGPVEDDEACDDVQPSLASERPGAADALAVPSLWDDLVPAPVDPTDRVDQVPPFEWGAAGTDSAFTSWEASVDEAVADVFAEASGSAVEPVAADAAASTDSHLDSLQSLLESIRARRAQLSEPPSGVD